MWKSNRFATDKPFSTYMALKRHIYQLLNARSIQNQAQTISHESPVIECTTILRCVPSFCYFESLEILFVLVLKVRTLIMH